MRAYSTETAKLLLRRFNDAFSAHSKVKGFSNTPWVKDSSSPGKSVPALPNARNEFFGNDYNWFTKQISRESSIDMARWRVLRHRRDPQTFSRTELIRLWLIAFEAELRANQLGLAVLISAITQSSTQTSAAASARQYKPNHQNDLGFRATSARPWLIHSCYNSLPVYLGVEKTIFQKAEQAGLLRSLSPPNQARKRDFSFAIAFATLVQQYYAGTPRTCACTQDAQYVANLNEQGIFVLDVFGKMGAITAAIVGGGAKPNEGKTERQLAAFLTILMGRHELATASDALSASYRILQDGQKSARAFSSLARLDLLDAFILKHRCLPVVSKARPS